MADQDRCPECGCEPGVTERIDAESAAFMARTGGDCPSCGRKSTPGKLRDQAGDASPLGPLGGQVVVSRADAELLASPAEGSISIPTHAEELAKRDAQARLRAALDKTSDEGAGDREARMPGSETREPVRLSPQPSVPPAGKATPDRQSGEGVVADIPSPDLPADDCHKPGHSTLIEVCDQKPTAHEPPGSDQPNDDSARPAEGSQHSGNDTKSGTGVSASAGYDAAAGAGTKLAGRTGSGSVDDLPDEVLDRLARKVAEFTGGRFPELDDDAYWDTFTPKGRAEYHGLLTEIGAELIEHGRQQEREWWQSYVATDLTDAVAFGAADERVRLKAEITEAEARGAAAEQARIRKLIETELLSDGEGRLDGRVGESIADMSGSYSLEFTAPDEVAQGLLAALDKEVDR